MISTSSSSPRRNGTQRASKDRGTCPSFRLYRIQGQPADAAGKAHGRFAKILMSGQSAPAARSFPARTDHTRRLPLSTERSFFFAATTLDDSFPILTHACYIINVQSICNEQRDLHTPHRPSTLPSRTSTLTSRHRRHEFQQHVPSTARGQWHLKWCQRHQRHCQW